jgi:protoheme IX farnesyltransferase
VRGAFIFGGVLTAAGLLFFFIIAGTLSGIVASLISASYLLFYTPLKRRSTLSTLAGGIPGALPPVLGWVTARNELSNDAIILFCILFFWQIPHFLALAWLYRKDYSRAGIVLLSNSDKNGLRTSRHAQISAALLVPTSMMPAVTGLTGPLYAPIAFALGAALFFLGYRFGSVAGGGGEDISPALNKSARRLFYGSLVYLPALFLALLAFKK